MVTLFRKTVFIIQLSKWFTSDENHGTVFILKLKNGFSIQKPIIDFHLTVIKMVDILRKP